MYKEFDIATAKIAADETGGIKHSLIDVLSPDEEFSAGNFAQMARNIVSNLSLSGKIPIIAGGTGLYLKMLLDGMEMPESEPDEALRQELENIVQNDGNEALYKILIDLDSEFAQKLHPNDTYKVMRSIEILKHTGKSMAESRGVGESRYDVLKICLSARDRDFLYKRINKRVDLMMEKGLEKEARDLYEKYPNSNAFSNTIGYQEFIPYFNSKCSLAEVTEKIKRNTRRYAKRQLTWFRAQEHIHWFYIDEMGSAEIEAEVFELISKWKA